MRVTVNGMLNLNLDNLGTMFKTSMKFELSSDQKRAMARFVEFMNSEIPVFILKGYAGTGKTTIVKEMVKFLGDHKKPYCLLASTGRAAKILRDATGISTETIHGLIYRYKDFNQDIEKLAEKHKTGKNDSAEPLLLQFEPVKMLKEYECYYFIDEASMVADKKDGGSIQAEFGSGRLLKDLLDFNSKGKFVFVGDPCQLPPVGQKSSPALSSAYFETVFGYKSMIVTLTEIKRQENDNDIVVAAQKLRRLYDNPQPWKWAKFPLKGYRNIHILGNQTELLGKYIETLKQEGYDETTMICFSNRQCNDVTQIIRPALGKKNNSLQVGDILLVTQNNYVSELMNGDIVVVNEIYGEEMRAGMTFVKVCVKNMANNHTFSQLLVADVLYGNETNISQLQQKDLFIDFYYRMKSMNIKKDSEEFKRRMMDDPFLNALRAVYGFALTCHKVQGGEWNKVFLDIPRNFALGERPFVYQWIYTAMTRAKKDLYVANDFYIE